ncbi:MAG: hypothetical protein IH586_21415 [Anaerolineaceae bacterium]|nr:hypothetical protein [Anaerolineaceae bacterium]
MKTTQSTSAMPVKLLYDDVGRSFGWAAYMAAPRILEIIYKLEAIDDPAYSAAHS